MRPTRANQLTAKTFTHAGRVLAALLVRAHISKFLSKNSSSTTQTFPSPVQPRIVFALFFFELLSTSIHTYSNGNLNRLSSKMPPKRANAAAKAAAAQPLRRSTRRRSTPNRYTPPPPPPKKVARKTATKGKAKAAKAVPKVFIPNNHRRRTPFDLQNTC